MEKSISDAVEPVQKLDIPVSFMAACGFSLYWACMFTMLMRNSFMDGDIEQLWYHLFLRVVFLAGSAIACVIIALKSDLLSSERGSRIRIAAVWLFSLVAAVSSMTSFFLEMTMPLAFDCIAWALAGIGLANLLMLWMEALIALPPKECAVGLIGSIILGSAGYLILNLLPFPFNIGLLCALPPISLGIRDMMERDSIVVAAPFVPIAQSRARARLSISFASLSTAYGIVFGLGIGSTTRIEGSIGLYSGIAAILILGAAAAAACLRFLPDRMGQAGIFRLLFPVLIVALIPMSFLQGMPSAICHLILLGCFILFEAVSLSVTLSISRKKKASCLYIVALGQTWLYLGMLLGNMIGLAATTSGIVDYSTLSASALVLVVVLAVIVTAMSITPLAGSKHSSGNGRSEEDEADTMPAMGHWKARCNSVAIANGLSARETEVFMLLAKGRGIEHIQNKLCISGHTVKTHVYNIYRKMGINSREELLDAIEDHDPKADASNAQPDQPSKDI